MTRRRNTEDEDHDAINDDGRIWPLPPLPPEFAPVPTIPLLIGPYRIMTTSETSTLNFVPPPYFVVEIDDGLGVDGTEAEMVAETTASTSALTAGWQIHVDSIRRNSWNGYISKRMSHAGGRRPTRRGFQFSYFTKVSMCCIAMEFLFIIIRS